MLPMVAEKGEQKRRAVVARGRESIHGCRRGGSAALCDEARRAEKGRQDQEGHILKSSKVEKKQSADGRGQKLRIETVKKMKLRARVRKLHRKKG